MSLRWIVTTATSIAVAIALAVIVPVAQLQLASDSPTCCCPNPDMCKCKQHKGDPSAPSMRACRGGPQDLVRAELPVFVPPAVIAVEQPQRAFVVAAVALPDPHPSPSPRRPDAPS